MKVQNIKTLAEEVQQLLNEEISFDLRYKINNLGNDINIVIDQVENTRLDLLQQYGVLVPDENRYIFETEENAEVFAKAYAEALEEDVDLSIHNFNIQEFGGITSPYPYREIFSLVN